MPEVQADFVAQGATVETSSPQALATLFKDELALDNMPHGQLAALAEKLG